MADFTSVPTSFVLELEDGVDKIAFVDASLGSFRLLDGTLTVAPPKAKEISYDSNALGRIKYVSRVYESREIRFAFQCLGATYDDVVQKMNRVAAMLDRAQSRTSFMGAGNGESIGYRSSYTESPYSRVSQTGDQGLTLRVRLGDQGSTTPVYTTEDGNTIAKTDIVSYRVYYGDWEWSNSFSVAGIQKRANNLYILDNIEVSLTCAPYAVGDSRVVSGPSASPLVYNPYPMSGGSVGTTNRVTIPAASVIGSAPALTRISTRSSGSIGMILSRDSYYSLWNSPGATRNTRTSEYHVKGILTVGFSSDVGKSVDLMITQLNPVKFKSRINGGAWTAETTPAAYTKYGVGLGTGAEDIGVIFTTTDFSALSGYLVNDVITFATHQAPVAPAVTSVNLLSSAAALLGGTYITQFYVSAQQKVGNKYKIMIPMIVSAGISIGFLEFRLRVSYRTANGNTSGSYTNWVSWPIVGRWLADLGTLDLTPSGIPGRGQPGAHTQIYIELYARSSSLITTASTLTINPAYLVACGDNGSYLQARWLTDEANGYEIVSNYDPDRPYMMEIGRAPSAVLATDPTTLSYDLDATYSGSFITLLPGMANTILAVGLFGDNMRDYRNSTPNGSLYDFTVAIRPRFVFAGS